MRTDVYQKITDRIVAELEQGVRPWMKPWSARNREGRIMRPLRANRREVRFHCEAPGDLAGGCLVVRGARCFLKPYFANQPEP